MPSKRVSAIFDCLVVVMNRPRWWITKGTIGPHQPAARTDGPTPWRWRHCSLLFIASRRRRLIRTSVLPETFLHSRVCLFAIVKYFQFRQFVSFKSMISKKNCWISWRGSESGLNNLWWNKDQKSVFNWTSLEWICTDLFANENMVEMHLTTRGRIF